MVRIGSRAPAGEAHYLISFPKTEESDMEQPIDIAARKEPWNKGKLVG